MLHANQSESQSQPKSHRSGCVRTCTSTLRMCMRTWSSFVLCVLVFFFLCVSPMYVYVPYKSDSKMRRLVRWWRQSVRSYEIYALCGTSQCARSHHTTPYNRSDLPTPNLYIPHIYKIECTHATRAFTFHSKCTWDGTRRLAKHNTLLLLLHHATTIHKPL